MTKESSSFPLSCRLNVHSTKYDKLDLYRRTISWARLSIVIIWVWWNTGYLALLLQRFKRFFKAVKLQVLQYELQHFVAVQFFIYFLIKLWLVYVGKRNSSEWVKAVVLIQRELINWCCICLSGVPLQRVKSFSKLFNLWKLFQCLFFPIWRNNNNISKD